MTTITTLSLRDPGTFETVEIERTVELKRDGQPVEPVPSTWESVRDSSFLADGTGWKIDKIEQFMNMQAARVYRGVASKEDQTVFFWFERLF